MIKEVNQICEKLNKKLGISITLPDSSNKAYKTAALCNFIVGTGLIVTGTVLTSKNCLILGGLGIASSVILRKESRQKPNDNHQI